MHRALPILRQTEGGLLVPLTCRRHGMRNALFVPVNEGDIMPGELLTAEQIRDGKYHPLRISGTFPECDLQVGPLNDLEAADGEFCYTDEEMPKIVSVAWWSQIGSYADGFGTAQQRTEDAALIEAMRDTIRDHQPACDETPLP